MFSLAINRPHANNKFSRRLVRNKRPRHRTGQRKPRRHNVSNKFSRKRDRSRHRHRVSNKRPSINRRHSPRSVRLRPLKISPRLRDRKPSQPLHQSRSLSTSSDRLLLRKKRKIRLRRKRKGKNHRPGSSNLKFYLH